MIILSVPPPPATVSPVAQPVAAVLSNLKISSPLPPVNVSTVAPPFDATSILFAADKEEAVIVISPAAVELSILRTVWLLLV
jgi:hypothetical protein